ncbi:MAG: dihydrolipoyllysine-residue acetyltransferase [Aquabacterium sp.]|nr:dihydrolipoyllysine-residue acetyltransferase [Aquabacterium sp.]
MPLTELRVPDIGDMADVPVIEILVKPGDTIKPEQSLITLESDKASMEVPASQGGVLKEIRVKLGDKVSAGSVIAVIEAAQAGAGQGEAAAAESSPAVPPSAASPDAHAASDASGQARAPAAAPAAAPPPSAAPSADPQASEPIPPGRLPHASPSVRRFARELGVALEQVQGSGPKGRITHEDVQGYVKAALSGQGRAPSAAPSAAAGGAGLSVLPWPQVDFTRFGPVERKPLSRIQKISGANLHRNWVLIPHVTNHDEADITELEALRVQLNREQDKLKDGAKVTMLAFLIKAVVAALKQYPVFNASLDGEELVLKQYFHIGFAADTPGGLVVPVIRDADRKGILQIARETAELARLARDGKLSPAQMQGGCFSISSLGGIGGTTFTPIINAPEVAILGVCRSAMKPVWDGQAFQPRLMLPLSLSYDHRVIDGAVAARFNAYLGQVLADFRRVLL